MKLKHNLHLMAVLACMIGSMASIPRPRGVSISMSSFYNPEKNFRCLDGSAEMPFEYVNDDYCDCQDGTDEPGTSACTNGKFHCTNAGYLPTNVLSSRVNDGICDCCDGADEWGGKIECVNNCKDLGKKLREEQDRVRILQEEGYQKRVTFSEEGKRIRQEKDAELAQIERERIDLENTKSELEAKKNEAETPEKEAKERHHQAWEESKAKRQAEMEKMHALIAFDELDTNDDQIVTVDEAAQHSAFDKDQDGTSTEQEVKEYLEDVDQADFDHFLEKVWPNIKQFYKPTDPGEETKGDNQDEPPTTGEPPAEPPTPSIDQIPSPPSRDDEEFDGEDDEEDEDEDEDEEGEEFKQEEDAMPEYDEETQKLIEAADEARNKFNDAEAAVREADRKITELKNYLNVDYGPDEEFSQLKGNCFEYTDREYTYKLCPFDKTSQRSKNGGSETTLGNWDQWDGPAEDKYSSQKYTRGQNCWNGPDRSTRVIITCGLENQLTGASEPSRCEYQFTFSTPSVCRQNSQQANILDHVHTEL